MTLAVTYQLVFAERKLLAIEVFPDMRVVVRAPEHESRAVIHRAVQRKRRSIGRQLRYFASFLPRTPNRRYVSGETHLYLGRQYRLKVLRNALEQGVKLTRGEICVRAGNDVKTPLDEWYRSHAKRVFKSRLNDWLSHPAFRRMDRVTLGIRKMSRRWGSCSRLGRISLNIDLIRASRASIDYVIVHELCHRLVPRHTAAFDRLLSKVLPDWRARKAELEMRLR